MNEETTKIVETVVEQPQVATAAVEVSKGLPGAAYVGIGAAGALAAYGIGCLIWNKGIKPLLAKKVVQEGDTKAEDKPEEKKEETTDNK